MGKLGVVVVLFGLLWVAILGKSASFRLEGVRRTIDLRDSVVKETLRMQITNVGNEHADHFELPVAIFESGQVGGVLAVEEDGGRLASERLGDGKVKIQVDLAPGATRKVKVRVSMLDVLQPLPAKIRQGQKQMLIYRGNLCLQTPVEITGMRTTVHLPEGSALERYGPQGATGLSRREGLLVSERACNGVEAFEVHYEYARAVPKFTWVRRVIEVSPWGNIAVEEQAELRNSGAELDGPFSRLDYARAMHMGGSPQNALASLKLKLPPNSVDMYYRDDIGNISTSNVFTGPVLELNPRFPLMPGWKTEYTMGYNVPAGELLWVSRSDSSLRLNTTLFTPVLEQSVPMQQLQVTVVLPEGATKWRVSGLSEDILKTLRISTTHTYLDMGAGRPTLTFFAHDLTPDANTFFVVDYEFSTVALAREPMLLIGAFLALFAVVMLGYRYRCLLGIRYTDPLLQTLPVQSDNLWIVRDFSSLHRRRTDRYRELMDVAQRAASDKSAVSEFAAKRSAVFADLTRADQDARKLLLAAERVQDPLNRRLLALEEVELVRHDVVSSVLALDKTFHDAKTSKSEHDTARASKIAQFEALSSRIQTGLDSLALDSKKVD